MAVVKSRALRITFIVLGVGSVGVGFIGVFLPLVPTVGPIILAGFFFSRSSERFDAWLINNRFFGSTINDWRSKAGFSVRAKLVAVAAIATSFAISITLVTDNLVARMALFTLGLAIIVYVVSRPTKQPHAVISATNT